MNMNAKGPPLFAIVPPKGQLNLLFGPPTVLGEQPHQGNYNWMVFPECNPRPTRFN